MNKIRHMSTDELIENEYNQRSRDEKMRNKRRDRRIDHALRTRDLDEYMRMYDEGEDPIDIEDEIWYNEVRR